MLTVAFVPGVTVRKWTRAWEERRADTRLEVLPTAEARQVAVLLDHEADLSFVRLPVDRDGLSVIRLYEEIPVAVLPREHALEAQPTVLLAELAKENVLEAADDIADIVELVAAGVGIVVLPQSIARLHNRKDVVARPVTDAPATEIAIAWLAAQTTADVEEFVGIVRGRTARSSRTAPTPPTPKPVRAKVSKPKPAIHSRKRKSGR
jgi:LysR substrate binding domain.